MTFLFDDDDDSGEFLFDDTPRVYGESTRLIMRDLIVVQPMKLQRGAHGNSTVPDGDAAWCRCLVVDRTNKNSSFSQNWAQDLNMDGLGQAESTMCRILAKEWHGDYYTRMWIDGDCYEADGSSVHLKTGSYGARHYEVVARLVVNAGFSDAMPCPQPPEGSHVWGE